MPPGGYVQGTAGSVQCSANISIADSTEGSLGNWVCFIHLLISEAPFQACGTQFSGLPRLPQLPKKGVLAGTDAPPVTTARSRLLTRGAGAAKHHLASPAPRPSMPKSPPPPTLGRRASSTDGKTCSPPRGCKAGQGCPAAASPTRNAPGGQSSSARVSFQVSDFETSTHPATHPHQLGQKLHILDHTGVCVC